MNHGDAVYEMHRSEFGTIIDADDEVVVVLWHRDMTLTVYEPDEAAATLVMA